jgi:hypothetical protein
LQLRGVGLPRWWCRWRWRIILKLGGHPGHRGHAIDGLVKSNALGLHHEAENIAVPAR